MTTARSSTRHTVDRSDLLVGIAAIGAVALLVGLGMGLTFFADEWSLIADRAITLPDLIRPFNEHWLAMTIVVHRAVFAVVGLHSYVPYLALLAVLHAIVAILVYALVRRRTLRPVAVSITLVVLVFGSGFENLFWGAQIGFVGATALGFGALLLLDDVPEPPGLGRAAFGAGLLTIAVMTSGYGLFMLGLVGFDLVLDPRRRRWIGLLLIPAMLYGAWYLAFGRSGIATHGDPFTLDRLVAVPRFAFDGLSAAFGAAAGGGATTGPFISAGIAAWIAYLAASHRPIPRRAIACLLTIVTVYLMVGLVRVQLGIEAATFTRYTYLTGMLALISTASLIGRPVIPKRQLAWALGAGVLVFIVSLGWNVSLLVAGRGLYAERAELTRALVMVGTTDPLPAGVDPELSLVLVPSPVELRRIVATHGSPLTDVVARGFVAPVSAAVLDEATRRAQNPPDWLLGEEPAP